MFIVVLLDSSPTLEVESEGREWAASDRYTMNDGAKAHLSLRRGGVPTETLKRCTFLINQLQSLRDSQLKLDRRTASNLGRLVAFSGVELDCW